MKKIQALVIANSGIHHHRIVNPLSYMPIREDWEIEILEQGTDEHKIDCDLLVYNKYCFTEPKFIRMLQDKGMKVVVDVDDAWHYHPKHPSYKLAKESGIGEVSDAHIKNADIVICTTLRLQEEVRKFNKNTAVIPNALPFGYAHYKPGDRVQGRKASGNNKTRFMYLSGSTHREDLKILEGKFTRIGGDPFITNNAEFVLCGYNPVMAKVYNNKKDYDEKNGNFNEKEVKGEYDIMANMFRSTKSFKIWPSIGLQHYLNYYDSADVAIAPLRETPWNNFKSGLKIVEAAAKGIPIMCSAVPPYFPDMVEFEREGVILIHKPDDWIKNIKYCIKNPSYVEDMGKKLMEWCSSEYDLIKWNVVRQQVFESLLK